jgi:NAD kinase
MKAFDQRIVIVTRDTQLQGLMKQVGTRSQAKFKIVSAAKQELSRAAAMAPAQVEAMAAAAFDELDVAAQLYEGSVKQLRSELDFDDFDLPVQTVDRNFLPNFVFGPSDVVVTVGQDGLVANTAKYALGRPIVAVNPDPQRIDGILLPFRTADARAAVRSVLQGKATYREVTLAQAQLPDGQKLLAFNELFIGNRTHISARYNLKIGQQSEPQSSSGVLVSTGAGSTGWLSSVLNMAAGVAAAFGRPTPRPAVQLSWEDPRLAYVVREPFVSRASRATLVAGVVDPGQELVIESNMPDNGVIFSDGVESDFLAFNAGAIARISTASVKARLVVK